MNIIMNQTRDIATQEIILLLGIVIKPDSESQVIG